MGGWGLPYGLDPLDGMPALAHRQIIEDNKDMIFRYRREAPAETTAPSSPGDGSDIFVTKLKESKILHTHPSESLD